jgi:hypothetical protein
MPTDAAFQFQVRKVLERFNKLVATKNLRLPEEFKFKSTLSRA